LIAGSGSDCYSRAIGSIWEDDMSQFMTYALFAVLWPIAFALVYAMLERTFPSALLPDHRDE
jgi:hypothetical protein